MEIIRIGVDLANNVFHVHGVDGKKKPVWAIRSAEVNVCLVMFFLTAGFPEGTAWEAESIRHDQVRT